MCSARPAIQPIRGSLCLPFPVSPPALLLTAGRDAFPQGEDDDPFNESVDSLLSSLHNPHKSQRPTMQARSGFLTSLK